MDYCVIHRRNFGQSFYIFVLSEDFECDFIKKKEEILKTIAIYIGLKMSEVETFHDSQAERDSEEEVIFRENSPHVENSTPNMITANDLDVVIEGWERKFEHLSQCLWEIQLASEKANSTMSNIVRDGRAREDIQERRIEEMHAGLTQFLERCDPRTSQHRAVSTHQPRARRSRLRECRLDCAMTSTSNLLSTRLQNPRATETTTTLENRHTSA